MSNDLVRRFRLLQEALNHGCSDGGCVIEVTKGQHTNGGCKCLYHPEQYTLNRVGHMLRCAQDMADHIEELENELHIMKTAGIVEVSVRNPSVMEYMKHWEGRAEAAEAKLAKAVQERDEALNQLDSARHSIAVLEKRVKTFSEGWGVADKGRIETEAKLAKAVGALGDIHNGEPEWPDDPQKELDWCRNRAGTTLAELRADQ